jgi:hypothetical protein
MEIGDSYRANDRRYTLTAKDPDQYAVSKIPADIGTYLIQHRLEHRTDNKPMTQGELGKLIGYSQRQVSRIERGEVQLDAAERDRVSAALDSIWLP